MTVRPDDEIIEQRGQILEAVDRPGSLSRRPAESPDFVADKEEMVLETSQGALHLQRYGRAYVHLIPGTPEFAAKYIPPGEPIIERIVPSGPEGMKVVCCDGVTGEPL